MNRMEKLDRSIKLAESIFIRATTERIRGLTPEAIEDMAINFDFFDKERERLAIVALDFAAAFYEKMDEIRATEAALDDE